MLHQPAASFEPSAPPSALDPAAYIQEMRAAGVTVTPAKTRKGLGFGLSAAAGFGEAYEIVAKRWHGLINEHEQGEYLVWHALNDEHRLAEAAERIGEDLQRGYRALEFDRKESLESVDCRAKRDAVEEAGERYHYLREYLVQLPIRSTADMATKAMLARDNIDNREVVDPILQQIIMHCAIGQMLQAAG